MDQHEKEQILREELTGIQFSATELVMRFERWKVLAHELTDGEFAQNGHLPLSHKEMMQILSDMTAVMPPPEDHWPGEDRFLKIEAPTAEMPTLVGGFEPVTEQKTWRVLHILRSLRRGSKQPD